MTDRRYGWFTLLTDCPHCGQPLPLGTPGTEVCCASCSQDVAIPESLWESVLEAFDDAHDQMVPCQPRRGTVSDHGFQVRYEYSLDVPRCEKCDTAFAVDHLEEGPARDFACVACGDPASTAPAPAWLVALVPTVKRIYSTDPGLAQEQAGASALQPSTEAIRPVSMSCPQCAGGLQVTTQSKRILACNFCQAEIYLPDVLWRRLHPVKTVQRFFIAFEGLSKAQECLADEREREAQAAQREAEIEAHRRARKEREYEELSRLAQEKAEQGSHILQSAWRVSKLAVGMLALCLAWVWSAQPVFGIGAMVGSGVMVTGLLGAMALIAVIVGMHWVSKPIDHATGNGFDWLLFVTWFWLPFVLVMPVAGTVMAWARAIILYRGKFSASTIESNGSRSSYGPVTLENGEGKPGAFLFLALGTLWPLIVAGVFAVA